MYRVECAAYYNAQCLLRQVKEPAIPLDLDFVDEFAPPTVMLPEQGLRSKYVQFRLQPLLRISLFMSDIAGIAIHFLMRPS